RQQQEPYTQRERHTQQEPYTQRERHTQQEPYTQREQHAQQEPYAQREPYAQQGQGRDQPQDQRFEFFAGAPRQQPYEPAPHIWPPHDEPHDDARSSR
ncbi:poly-gamma-glutamate synthase PgsB, partial [Streptomyces globisporus]